MVRIVSISDTHGFHGELTVPDGDILIHAGDFTNIGSEKDFILFNKWLGEIKHRYKHIVVTFGNHERLVDKDMPLARSLLNNAIVLHDEAATIEEFKIYASGWTPEFGHGWALNLHRQDPKLKAVWEAIPDDTDILITHGPAHGILDTVRTAFGETHVGCVELRKRIDNMPNLKLHVCGHIHCSFGTFYQRSTRFVNASSCSEWYSPVNDPIVIDL